MVFHPAKILLLQLYDKNCSNDILNSSFIDFCIYFNKLTKHFVKGAIHDQQLVDVILLKDDLTKRNNYQKHIYAANSTLQRLFRNLFPSNIKVHSHILITLLFDFYPIISIAEDFKTNGDPLGTGHRDEQTGREIFDASRFIYYIQSTTPAESYLREIVPVSIFLVRQSLEILGKNCLGLYSITTHSNQRYKNTNVAWDFITIDQRKSDPKVRLPVKVDVINKIIIWTNSYIHSGNLKEYYIIENILHILSKLYFQNITMQVANFEGMLVSFGIIQIRDFELVRRDFEKYINRIEYSKWQQFLIKIGFKKVKMKWQVTWLDPKHIKEATIVNK